MVHVLKKPSRIFLTMALVSLLWLLIAGVFSIFQYLPQAIPNLKEAAVTMPLTRSTHVIFAIAWVYLIGVAMVYRFIDEELGGLNPQQKLVSYGQAGVWLLAGIVSQLSFFQHIFSGRQYLDYPLVASGLIFFGWLLYFSNLLQKFRSGFLSAPVYVYMWMASGGLFILSYSEAHVLDLPQIGDYPVRDFTNSMEVNWHHGGVIQLASLWFRTLFG